MVINLKKNVQIYKYLSNRQSFWKILTITIPAKGRIYQPNPSPFPTWVVTQKSYRKWLSSIIVPPSR
mgnify:CR=1 FL=1